MRTGGRLSQDGLAAQQCHQGSKVCLSSFCWVCGFLLYSCKMAAAALDITIRAFPEAPKQNFHYIFLGRTGSHGLPWLQGRLGH